MDKDLFLAYERVRKSGKYNMIVDCHHVMIDIGLNPHIKAENDKYWDIIKNYGAYADRWLKQP